MRTCTYYLARPSHPTWVRGLKLEELGQTFSHGLSHPTWVRGLKLSVLGAIG